MRTRLLLWMWVVATAAGCVTAPSSPPAAKAPATVPDSIRWFRDSAEQKAVYLETYRAAAASAKSLAAGLGKGTWGVILDVDETILDNSPYQKELALSGASYDPKTWNAWVQSRSALALPGAQSFVDGVLDALHGQVVLVTNRKQDQCTATEDNLRTQHIRYSRILCDKTGDGDKNPRFKAVQNGEAGQTNPLTVIIWIGDNIQDFPALSQAAPGDFSLFGTRYFALPNPLYGSWQR